VKISARNVFKTKVTAVKVGSVNSEIELATSTGEKIVAMVTNESAKALNLSIGRDTTALIKASSVLVMTEGADVKLSARNCLPGKISKILEGPVSAEVTIALASGAAVQATITHQAVKELGLKKGAAASAVFKAGAVILAVAA